MILGGIKLQILKENIEVEVVKMTKQEYNNKLKEYYNKGRKSLAIDIMNIIKNIEYKLNWKGLDILCSRIISRIVSESE